MRSSLCGADGLSLARPIDFATLASTVDIGPLEPALLLAAPTTSTSAVAASIRPATTIATSAILFAALSLFHSPSLGRRRREKDNKQPPILCAGWRYLFWQY